MAGSIPPGDNPSVDAANDLGRPCAVCGKPSMPGYKPFCSKRCADVDLNRWLGEHYRIPSDEPATEDMHAMGDMQAGHGQDRDSFDN